MLVVGLFDRFLDTVVGIGIHFDDVSEHHGYRRMLFWQISQN